METYSSLSDSDETLSAFSSDGELEEGEIVDSELEEGEIVESEEEDLELDEEPSSDPACIRIFLQDLTRVIPIVVGCSDTGYTITNGCKSLSYDGIDKFWMDHLRYSITAFLMARRPFSTTIYATDSKTRLRIQKCWKSRSYPLLIHTIEYGRLPSSSCQDCRERDCHRLKAIQILKRISS